MSLKILFVDDDPSALHVAAGLITDMGYDCTPYENAADALSHVKSSNDVDLVITDVRMPVMDGMELMKEIKSISPLLPVALITGHGDVELAIEALRNGAKDFIRKPCRLAELQRLIDSITVPAHATSMSSVCSSLSLDIPVATDAATFQSQIDQALVQVVEFTEKGVSKSLLSDFISCAFYGVYALLNDALPTSMDEDGYRKGVISNLGKHVNSGVISIQMELKEKQLCAVSSLGHLRKDFSGLAPLWAAKRIRLAFDRDDMCLTACLDA